MKLTCVVIDDEPESVEDILEYIENTGVIKLLKSFNKPVEALNFLKENGPVDLVFMDVDMPVLSGVDLSSMIRHHVKNLIFTTSHAKYALDAFEVSAEGFLLKPFNFAKFLVTVEKFFPTNLQSESNNVSGDYIFVKSKEDDLKLIKVNIADIIALESQLNYIRIYTLRGNIVTHMSLKEAKELLVNYDHIIQLHRSFLISTNHILSVEGNKLSMCNDTRFTIGDNFKDTLNKYLGSKIFKASSKKS